MSFKNIGLLDLRKGTETVLKEIQSMVNIGTLIIREGQVPHLAKARQVNIGSVFTVPEDQEVHLIQHNGDFEVDLVFLRGLQAQVMLFINGQMRIEPDVTPEDLGPLFRLVIHGDAQVPSALKACFALKSEVNGKVMYYDPEDVLVRTPMYLSEDSLWNFAPGSVVRVDHLVATEVIPLSRLQDTFSKFKVKKIVARQEMLRNLAGLVDRFHEVEKTLVPEGYAYFESLELVDAEVKQLVARGITKVFVEDKLTIRDLSDQGIQDLLLLEGIQCNKLVVQESLQEPVNQRLVSAKTVKVLAKNSRENYSKLLINSSYLESTSELVIGNYGKLIFDQAIRPEVFDQGIKRIENYGKILCSHDLYPLVMGKVHKNYGVVKATDLSETPKQVQSPEGDKQDQVAAENGYRDETWDWEPETQIVNLETYKL